MKFKGIYLIISTFVSFWNISRHFILNHSSQNWTDYLGTFQIKISTDSIESHPKHWIWLDAASYCSLGFLQVILFIRQNIQLNLKYIANNSNFDVHLHLLIENISFSFWSATLFEGTYAKPEEFSIPKIQDLANGEVVNSDFFHICDREYRLTLKRLQPSQVQPSEIRITLVRRNNSGSHYQTLKIDIQGESGLVTVYETKNGGIPNETPTTLNPMTIKNDIKTDSNGSATVKFTATCTKPVAKIDKIKNWWK